MTLPQTYACRIAAAILVWLALVLWGSAFVAFFPAFAQAVTPAYRVMASALAPLGMVWAFWVTNPLYALLGGGRLALSGGLALVLQA
ncbi:hypothetical protein [Acetobacter sp. LMG 32666]|uniref:hypothetical protein n=1 Tax=Acetobacter sp. LMG 32666 TaxID=2959295 RepID=UPI0030C83B0E